MVAMPSAPNVSTTTFTEDSQSDERKRHADGHQSRPRKVGKDHEMSGLVRGRRVAPAIRPDFGDHQVIFLHVPP